MICIAAAFFCLSHLSAQDKPNTDAAKKDSVDTKKRDSVLLRQINPEDMFRKKIAVRDSSSFNKKTIKKQLKTYPDYKRWRFGVSGGFELIIAPEPTNIPKELQDYRKPLKSGSRFGADATFFVSSNIGLGINYSTFAASNKVDRISYEITGNLYESKRQDDINIHFVGPSISIRSIPKHNKLYVSCDFTMGYFAYTNKLVFNNTEYDLKGENFGFATSIGTDFMFLKNMSVGVLFNITAASVKKVEIFSGNDVENLSRISLALTLKTYK
ncbi:MAG: hypothetical protein LBQ70_00225 [Prevotellaceae bacterium]|nr:hypothetical protein [Prevotellaceae bacterium]